MTVKSKEKKKHKPKKHREDVPVQPEQRPLVFEPSTKDPDRPVEPLTKPTRR